MELSSKIKSMKFMKRKEDAAQRQEQEVTQQKAVERKHWALDAAEGAAVRETRPEFIVEYDLSASTSAVVSRQSYNLDEGKPKGSSKE